MDIPPPYNYASQPKAIVHCPLCGRYRPWTVQSDRYGFTVGYSHCLECCIGYLNPRMTEEAYWTFHQAHYRPLLEWRFPDTNLPPGLEAQHGEALGRLFRVWGLKGDGRLLDYGGDTGLATQALVEALGASSVTIYDPTNTQILEPPYDAIVCTRTLDHICDPLEALRTMRRLVAPDGWLWVDIAVSLPRLAPTPLAFADDNLNLAMGCAKRLPLKIDHPLYWTKASLRKALALAGWGAPIQEMRYHDHYGYIVKPAIINPAKGLDA